MRIRIIFILLGFVLSTETTLAQQRSAKRGVGWDEKLQPLTTSPIDKMSPGISWLYNWGLTPQGSATNIGPQQDMEFVPMCWNGGFNETTLRNYLSGHPGVKYLLGFNEPNFSSQSNMTPQQAADKWPKLEQIAADYNLKLVAPALNFSGEKVGGRTWSPYEWYDEFFRLYPTAKLDYLALHCYMNWYSSNTWFATEYFYKDLYDPSKTDVYGRYPNLKEYLDNYKAANGHFPKMFLTEFCAWENDGTIKNVDFQIDQMTQKVQKLEQSDLVEAYAWFMGNASGGAATYPYMSIFQTNTPSSELSELGRVYVHMSSFDTDKYYSLNEDVKAKDYVDASTDNQQVRLRTTTDNEGISPLQVDFLSGAWAGWQFTIPTDGDYTLSLRMKSSGDNAIRIYLDAFGSANTKLKTTLPTTNGLWTNAEVQVTLPAGQHRLILWNGGSTSLYLDALKLNAVDTGICLIDRSAEGRLQGKNVQCTMDNGVWYTLDGRRIANTHHLTPNTQLPKGIYIVNGKKYIIK